MGYPPLPSAMCFHHSVEADYEAKLKELQERHARELAALNSSTSGGGAGTGDATPGDKGSTTLSSTNRTPQPSEEQAPPSNTEMDEETAKRLKKQEKARKKRDKQRQQELEKQRQIDEETKNAGPSARVVEFQHIQQHLPPQAKIVEIEADGHCLYRAIAAQCELSNYQSHQYGVIRNICADSLKTHADDFAPFCEYTDTVPDFETYVQYVQDSAEWGGHLELRALSMALHRPITIYRAESSEPLVIDGQTTTSSSTNDEGKEPIRLSYHLNYYALGEHYNQVVLENEGED